MNTDRLLKTIQWWEKKRIWFNISICFVGICVFLQHTEYINYDLRHHVIHSIIWLILANLFYSSGILLEAFNIHYLKNKINFFEFRLLFIIVGTLFSCLLTYIHTLLYYIGFW